MMVTDVNIHACFLYFFFRDKDILVTYVRNVENALEQVRTIGVTLLTYLLKQAECHDLFVDSVWSQRYIQLTFFSIEIN